MADVDKELRVLIVGAGGQVGRALLSSVPMNVTATGLDHADLDIDDARAIAGAVREHRPHILVNAAAYTNVDGAETHPDIAYAINAAGPAKLAAATHAAQVRLIHLSSDFVFDGLGEIPLRPEAATGPLNIYGASKAAGEHAVRDIAPDALIVRTARVYAAEGHNFVLTMLRQMARTAAVSVIADQIGTPTHARSLALGVWGLIDGAPPGTYHLTDAGRASWYEFAVAIGEDAHAIGLLARKPIVQPIRTVDYPTSAQRPRFSVLDCTAAWQHLGHAPPPWRQELGVMLAEVKALAAHERRRA